MHHDLWVISFGSLYSKGWGVTQTLNQSVWNIYVLQNRIVYVIKRLKRLFLDPYIFQFCKYRHASKLFVYLYLHLLLLFFVGSSPRTFTVSSICEIESLCFWHIFKVIADSEIKTYLLCHSSDVFPLNISSNNMYSEYFSTVYSGNNIERYFHVNLWRWLGQTGSFYALRINLLK